MGRVEWKRRCLFHFREFRYYEHFIFGLKFREKRPSIFIFAKTNYFYVHVSAEIIIIFAYKANFCKLPRAFAHDLHTISRTSIFCENALVSGQTFNGFLGLSSHPKYSPNRSHRLLCVTRRHCKLSLNCKLVFLI